MGRSDCQEGPRNDNVTTMTSQTCKKSSAMTIQGKDRDYRVVGPKVSMYGLSAVQSSAHERQSNWALKLT